MAHLIDHNRTSLAALTIAAASLLITSCSGGTTTGADGTTSATKATPPAPTVSISPAKGTSRVRPDKNIVVSAAGGSLRNVVVRAGGKTVKGEFNDTRTRWRSIGALRPSTTYTVTATAAGDGGPVTKTSTFSTLKPRNALAIVDVTPAIKGETLGVGAPIIVTFNHDIKDKAAIEEALKVKAEKPVAGAWRWISDRQVIYRTAKFWPAHQKVIFSAHLTGVRADADTYGMKDRTTVLKIGSAWISTVSVPKHQMIVRKDGKIIKTMKISAGKATSREYTTTNGIHLTMERGNPVVMTSPGKKKGDPGYYREIVNHAVRISSSGEYVHSAPWSVGAQGRANVSHGCINARPDQAKWFYDNYHRGDVVEISGTNRELEWNNGWGFWQLSFKQWKKGSALSA
ncbi:MAG TPA: Ig-like domain-containing protein [Thermopolyspora sp.]|jgi:Uncharacterized protein conserved in bacteria